MARCESFKKKCLPVLTHIQLQKGADRARADDTNTLKSSVAIWLNEQRPHPVPPLSVTEKRGRGFGHEVTGRLLSPVDYNWSNPVYVHVHTPSAVIHELLELFLVFVVQSRITTHTTSLPHTCGRDSCTEKATMIEHTHPKVYSRENFLCKYVDQLWIYYHTYRSFQAFRCIFTSPSSACEDPTASSDSDEEQPRPSRVYHRVHTRSNVARLSNMQTVQPRAIAYIAVQVYSQLHYRSTKSHSRVIASFRIV